MPALIRAVRKRLGLACQVPTTISWGSHIDESCLHLPRANYEVTTERGGRQHFGHLWEVVLGTTSNKSDAQVRVARLPWYVYE